jgi:hypothetical protein
MSELLYHDDFLGLTHEYAQIDDKSFVVKTSGDTQPILDANKHDANHAPNWSPTRDMKHVARIPPEIYMIWLHRYGIDALNPDHAGAVRKLLNDNEWAYLRTGGGRL